LRPIVQSAAFTFGSCIYRGEDQEDIIDQICEHYLDSDRVFSMEERFAGFARSVIACGAFFKTRRL
jgi:hypothetical protein